MSENIVEIDKEELEGLIESKVEERVEERVQKELEKGKSTKKESESGMSRRGFLKKLGAGAVGLGALSLSASALNVRSDDLTFYGADSSQELEVLDGGPVNIKNANLQLNGNSIEGVEYLKLNNIEFGSLPTEEFVIGIDNSESPKYYHNGSWRKFWTSKNDGDGSGLNADMVDGEEPPFGQMPSGAIVMWSGSISNIPSGWVLCDGNNGTPDLRDRFVVGAGNSYNVGNTGGEASHNLTESEMPSHNHGIKEVSNVNDSNIGEGFTHNDGDTSYINFSQDAGGDSAHENRPPYHALAYIQKV